MTYKVTIETDVLPEDVAALEQSHNAGLPAVTVGYASVDPASVVPPAALSPDELRHQERHPEDFQLHNAGKPAVVTGGGNELTVPQAWDEDLSTH